MKKTFGPLVWQEVFWQRPFEIETVQELLTHLASVTPRGPVVWEVRGHKNQIRYFVASAKEYLNKTKDTFSAHGNIQFADITNSDRKSVTVSKQLKISNQILSLNTDIAPAFIRSALAAMSQSGGSKETVLQIILGPSYSPRPLPGRMPDPHASLFSVITGNVGPASAESKASMSEKTGAHGFHATLRIGSSGGTTAANAHIYSILSSLKTLESAGVQITAVTDDPYILNTADIPKKFTLRLSVKELSAMFLLPAGEADLSGIPSPHPKLLLPPTWYRSNQDRAFAVSLGAAGGTYLHISPQDSLEHTIILGPTGSGKSTAMLSLILSDINAGRSVLVIDPKADLVNDILARVPAHRTGDVVIIDPSAPCPVGFNPFALTGYNHPTLVADAVLSVFKEVFAENWGIRSQDVLSAALLTLAQTKDASMLWLPTLLTNDVFRKKITGSIQDRIGLEPYWSAFESMKDSERRQEIAPVLNKIRQFLLRPGLRNILGQSQPKFSLTDLFYKNKVVLVPLNKGLIGSESAKLLGSLIIGMTWTLALSRANLPANQRQLVSVYIDELQDYLSLPTDFSDALAQARGLGVGLTLAHQYRNQLPPEIRAGVDTNARNKIVFGLNSSDAKDMAAMAPELEAIDFMSLPRYQIYASLQSGGRNTGWVSGKTLPPSPAIRSADTLRQSCAEVYGRPEEEVETDYLNLLASVQPPAPQPTEELPPVDSAPIGRKRREP